MNFDVRQTSRKKVLLTFEDWPIREGDTLSLSYIFS